MRTRQAQAASPGTGGMGGLPGCRSRARWGDGRALLKGRPGEKRKKHPARGQPGSLPPFGPEARPAGPSSRAACGPRAGSPRPPPAGPSLAPEAARAEPGSWPRPWEEPAGGRRAGTRAPEAEIWLPAVSISGPQFPQQTAEIVVPTCIIFRCFLIPEALPGQLSAHNHEQFQEPRKADTGK